MSQSRLFGKNNETYSSDFLSSINSLQQGNRIVESTDLEVLAQNRKDIQVYTVEVNRLDKLFNIKVIQIGETIILIESGTPDNQNFMRLPGVKEASYGLLTEVFRSVIDTASEKLPRFNVYLGLYSQNFEGSFDGQRLEMVGNDQVTERFSQYFDPRGDVAAQMPLKSFLYGNFPEVTSE